MKGNRSHFNEYNKELLSIVDSLPLGSIEMVSLPDSMLGFPNEVMCFSCLTKSPKRDLIDFLSSGDASAIILPSEPCFSPYNWMLRY